MNTMVNAQSWLDTNLYPFESNYIQLQNGRMHYLDEGRGEVILFVHGTPTWSFLYRHFIEVFSKTHRCIAIDHLGFGLSEKPLDFEGSAQAHSENLTEFIDKLELEQVTLVVHDFGGPIALGWANEHPEKVKQIVLFNSWLWKTAGDPEAQKADRLIRSSLGRFLYLYLNISPRLLLKKGFADKSRLSPKLHRHYLKPFPDKHSRLGLYRIAKSLVGSSDWYRQQWDHLASLEEKPWLILWGMKDDFLKPSYLEKWQYRLPHATVKTLDCGHFVQEEATSDALMAMKRFLAN